MHTFPEEKVERLIHISKEKPLDPDEFIPWEREITPNDKFLPEHLVSLYGHKFYNTLSDQQKRELERHELTQVVYSYAWSEGIACLFFNRHLITLKSNSTEYRFLVRELIEEFRHQQMFSDVVRKIDGDPIKPSGWHQKIGKFTAKYAPADWVFMSVLAVEMVSDAFGKHLRKDDSVIKILQKTAELHAIEEGRHMFYTKLWMDKFLKNAGVFKRTIYSIIFLANIYFMRTMYVRKEIFERIGVENPVEMYKASKMNYKQIFADACLDEAVEFVADFNGFNGFTRMLWSRILGVDFEKYSSKVATI